jgi:hypothetical protein
MKFTLTTPNENFLLRRFVSEQGLWEFGLRAMMFGVRVSLSRVSDAWYTLDYCAGDDPGFVLILLATVAVILERYPETIAPSQLEREFPHYEYKPINRDKCWGKLQQMAGIDPEPSITCPVCGRTSYNSNDRLHRYCGICHQYHDLMAMQAALETAQKGGDRNG